MPSVPVKCNIAGLDEDDNEVDDEDDNKDDNVDAYDDNDEQWGEGERVS